MPEPKVPLTLEGLARRVAELESVRARDREEQKREFAALLAGARKTIEETIARSEPLTQMRDLMQMNEEQVGLLRDAREERIRRSERDRVAAEEKAQAAAARAEAEKKAAEDKAQLDKDTAAALLAADARFKRQVRIFGLVITLVGALSAWTASCAGAFRTPSAAKDTSHDHAP